MDGTARREAITSLLQQASAPLSASRLAEALGVSRQLVVGDIALLRAGGAPIAATPRGYVLQEAISSGLVCTVACRHSQKEIVDELYTMVDCGCMVRDVIVEHPVYGQLIGSLQVASRYDADLFCAALAREDALPLSRLTGDIHLHTLVCPGAAQKERVLQALEEKGYLVVETQKEP